MSGIGEKRFGSERMTTEEFINLLNEWKDDIENYFGEGEFELAEKLVKDRSRLGLAVSQGCESMADYNFRLRQFEDVMIVFKDVYEKVWRLADRSKRFLTSSDNFPDEDEDFVF